MQQIKLVVCDMAGTTVRDLGEVESCFSAACRQTGLVISDERIKAVQGWSKRHVFQVLWTEILGEEAPELESHINQSYGVFKEILENHYLTSSVFPTEGTLDFFDFCRQNKIKIALTTGFYRKVTDIILQKLGWLEGLNEDYVSTGDSLIDCSISGDEVPNGRPAPDMIFLAMKKLGIDSPQQVISVGDTPSDLQCGRNAGVRAVFGLTNGTHSEELLRPFENDGLLDSIHELIPVLQKFNSI
jgi:phosphonatase-like hydrolase